LHRFTPRRAGSTWSAINRARVGRRVVARAAPRAGPRGAWMRWIAAAKQAETRVRRAAKAASELAKGRQQPAA